VAVLGRKAGPQFEKAQAYVNRILSTQDTDGYIGIYDRQMRYRFDKENGELWAQATVLRSLLGWYEFTRERRILAAVERAVQNVMAGYPIDKSHPFYSTTPYVGGLSHGLMFTDVLENLHRLTGKEEYRRYALFLYKDFSRQTLAEDAQYSKAIDPKLPLNGHGVHTYEHLRSLAAAYYASGNPLLKTALDGYQAKIARATAPSGGPIGDEWVGGRPADATRTGYEYCSLEELLHGYAGLLAKTGQPDYGDKAERLFFNAAMGARHPTESCIAYLKTDNSYQMTGGLNFDTTQKKQTRYKYSPAHQDAAVCCVPNAGRILPYYVQHMWMKQAAKNGQGGEALVAMLAGPCRVNTVVNGSKVSITESNAHSATGPEALDYTFLVESGTSNTFQVRLRKPAWAIRATVEGIDPGRVKEEGSYLVIRKTWKGKELFKLNLEARPKAEETPTGEVFYTYGRFVLAAPIPDRDSATRAFPLPGFRDLAVRPRGAVVPYTVRPGAMPALAPGSGRDVAIGAQLDVLNPKTGRPERIDLVPIGGTVLRQVTFGKE
jgi:DUF1680 family protein